MMRVPQSAWRRVRRTAIAAAAAACCACGNAGVGEFTPGAAGDPVVQRSDALGAPSACASATPQGNVVLFEDEFPGSIGDLGWPASAGYDGDFNAEWVTDGNTARAVNPTWPEAAPSAPQLPVVTGFVKFLDFCPVPNTKMSAAAKAVTDLYTDNTSDATLVVYFFDGAGALITVKTTATLYHNNNKEIAFRDFPLPPATRRIAVVPMARLGPNEAGTIHYDWVRVELSTSANTVDLSVTDDFSTVGTGAFGANQPAGWAEYGSDWFSHPTMRWLTVSNPSWNGAPTGVETGAFRDIDLTGVVNPGSVLNAGLFSSATLSDPTSFALLRISFNDGSASIDSPRLKGWSYDTLDLRNVAVPVSATSVRVQVVSYLGVAEPSSLYADDFRLTIERPAVKLMAAKIYGPTTWFDGVASFPAPQLVFVPQSLPIDTQSYPTGQSPWSLAAGNSGNHTAEVWFDRADGTRVTCSYRGGSSVAHPGSNPNQLALAQRYNFVSCTGGLLAGQSVAAARVTLHINNGDSFMASTRIALTIPHVPAP